MKRKAVRKTKYRNTKKVITRKVITKDVIIMIETTDPKMKIQKYERVR